MKIFLNILYTMMIAPIGFIFGFLYGALIYPFDLAITLVSKIWRKDT